MRFVQQAKLARRLVEIEAGGVEWRVRPPSPMDVLGAGAKAMPRIVSPPPDGGAEAAPVPLDPALKMAMLMESAESAKDLQAIVCAAVVGVKAPGQDWTPCRLVLELAEEGDEDDTMWIGTLPPHVQMEILSASLAAQGGAFDRVLATFPRRSE